jgi:hypothetical protein
MERLLAILTGISMMVIVIVLFSIRRAHIRVEYSVSWLSASVVLLILSLWRAPLDHLSVWLGINNPPVSLLLIVLCVFLVVFYRFSVIISDLKDANIALTQKVAILEYQIQHVHEKSSETPAQS